MVRLLWFCTVDSAVSVGANDLLASLWTPAYIVEKKRGQVQTVPVSAILLTFRIR